MLLTLIIVKENLWSDNLSIFVKKIIKLYPEKKEIVRELYKLTKKPINDKDQILSLSDAVVKWFKVEYNLITETTL